LSVKRHFLAAGFGDFTTVSKKALVVPTTERSTVSLASEIRDPADFVPFDSTKSF
jgi:hypothetical protein